MYVSHYVCEYRVERCEQKVGETKRSQETLLMTLNGALAKSGKKCLEPLQSDSSQVQKFAVQRRDVSESRSKE